MPVLLGSGRVELPHPVGVKCGLRTPLPSVKAACVSVLGKSLSEHSYPLLCYSKPSPVYHQLPELAQTHVH